MTLTAQLCFIDIISDVPVETCTIIKLIHNLTFSLFTVFRAREFGTSTTPIHSRFELVKQLSDPLLLLPPLRSLVFDQAGLSIHE